MTTKIVLLEITESSNSLIVKEIIPETNTNYALRTPTGFNVNHIQNEIVKFSPLSPVFFSFFTLDF